MMQTHKPRGHRWTHASEFQQTEGYRDVHFDECVAPSANVRFLGTGEERSIAAQTARQKNRVESLAKEFLDGKPLRIASARPSPEELRSTIHRNNKSSTEPKPGSEDFDRSCDPTSIWEDVEDDWDLLRRIGRLSSETNSRLYSNDSPHHASHSDQDVVERASASCGRTQKARAFHLASRPSEDALRIAAALRHRRIQRLQGETMNEAQVRGELVNAANVAEAEAPVRANTWLSRRASHVFRSDVDEESLDELRLSSIETPPVQPSLFKHGRRPRVYTTEEGKGQDLTPFKFRKRGSGSGTEKRDQLGSTLDMSRRASEPPPVVHVEGLPSVAGEESPTVPSQCWPGTQVLLCQAQQDLFISPDKQSDNTVPAGDAEHTPTHPSPIEPLKQLSQEQLPSTQMMLAAFEGFSTVKKPRHLSTSSEMKASHMPTKETMSPCNPLSTRRTEAASAQSDRRSSGLRHSMVSTISPERPSEMLTPVGTAASDPQSPRGMSTTELATPAPGPATSRHSLRSSWSSSEPSLPTNPIAFRDRGSSSQSFGPAAAEYVPSYQAAQGQESLLSEGELDKTIDELTTDVLGLGDMAGIMSQG